MLKRYRERLYIGLILVACCFILIPRAETESRTAQTITGRVVHIADGDTITVLRDNMQYRIRLWGIAAPAMKQPFGTRASEHCSSLAFAQIVTVRVRDLDRAGRTVGEVFLPDGRNLNHEMVRAGLAWWYRHYAPHEDELERLENQAQEVHRGLWADAKPMSPWEFRTRNLTR